ncbi:hypothetical protein Z946_3898 [Sulfitobacter noctilucicola]|uniref:Uncharacterized protein n=1 Tax=Sulfitobacter noctilucicola TaxID=1342301 RepID=A0A7W6Q466_9RHOB|nr:hypothetical protein [Sulfitobacter noctilucicola]KIN65001.1 hypothetical protein Z946_3898 [Sulfitobacter noctilucicola]MBB4173859.1 hypothetical protein [Sulfitobacter noctilucicola]
MSLRALAFVTAAALALPQTAAACFQLSQSVWMCGGGTSWQDATWDVFGDGATLLFEDYALSFTEDFPGADIRDGVTTLEEQYVTYATLAEADGNPPLEVVRQETLEIAAGRAFRSLQLDRYEDVETVSAVMMADVDAARIMLYLDGPQTLDWDVIDADSRAVLDMLRGSCADQKTCISADRAKERNE